jgi:hypothetical protein
MLRDVTKQTTVIRIAMFFMRMQSVIVSIASIFIPVNALLVN